MNWKFSSMLALAIPFTYSATLADPIDDADCTQPQHAQRIINHCSSLTYKAADERLTALYEKAGAALTDAGDRNRLKASQDAWTAYRSAQCTLLAPPSRRGSMWSAVYTTCARLLTEARIVELQTYLFCDLRTDDTKCSGIVATRPETKTE